MLIYCAFIAMRVEWSKAKARADRWHEEVLLTTEEMHHTICFLEWKAVWWLDKVDSRSDATLSVKHGLAAYAAKQADVCRCLAASLQANGV